MEYSRGTERERIYRTLSALPIDFKPLSGACRLLRMFVKESKRCSITAYCNTMRYNSEGTTHQNAWSFMAFLFTCMPIHPSLTY
jgi:hypothetical protein